MFFRNSSYAGAAHGTKQGMTWEMFWNSLNLASLNLSQVAS